VKGEIPLIYEISLTPILYINSLRACVCDTTVPRFNPPAEPARTVGAGGPDSRIRKPGSERTRERFDCERERLGVGSETARKEL
jgi:hypothetical protein